jgi:anhydro-N-acetylmuramic acid kinase
MRAIGMMSGTSMDGIDIALIETDGEANVTRRAATSRQYTPSQRDGLAAAMVEASRMLDRNERPGSLGRIERHLTELHAQLVHDFLAENGVDAGSVDVIGFHGQTVLHRAEERLTVQLGDGALLARLTRVPVVYDMRAADIAAGGQGAPLAPAYHRAFAAKLSERPVAILNIGGVANVTWIGEGEDILAFDTGPGNALMDDWVSRQSNEPYDRDGALARTGNVDIDRLSVYLKHPYLQQRAPKSLDRYDFTLRPLDGLATADGAATLAQVTVVAVVRSVSLMPEPPKAWVICGGGRHNGFLMELLRRHLEAPVLSAEDIGLNGDSIEAEAWAYLAVRSLKSLPITFPGTTGVAAPMTGGVLARPD